MQASLFLCRGLFFSCALVPYALNYFDREICIMKAIKVILMRDTLRSLPRNITRYYLMGSKQAVSRQLRVGKSGLTSIEFALTPIVDLVIMN